VHPKNINEAVCSKYFLSERTVNCHGMFALKSYFWI